MDLESWQLTTLHLFVNILFLPSPPDQPLIVDRWNGPIGSQRLHVTSSQLCIEKILPSKIDNCSDFCDFCQIYINSGNQLSKLIWFQFTENQTIFFILPPFFSYTQAKNIKRVKFSTRMVHFWGSLLLFFSKSCSILGSLDRKCCPKPSFLTPLDKDFRPSLR